jgi:DNA replication protein DnaC
MKMHAMADTWLEHQRDPQMNSLDFDERFGLLIDAESLARENRRLTRRLQEARLRITTACIEDIEHRNGRGLTKSVSRQLASCAWIVAHQNLTIVGATGTGKTYVACALAQQACRKGYRATYRRATRLFHELMLARADGSYARLLSHLNRLDLLVIDDFGLASMGEQERQDLLEILEDRYDMRSTIIASQLPVENWHEQLGDPTVADAILDRVLHNAHRVVLQGPSRRKEVSPLQ